MDTPRPSIFMLVMVQVTGTLLCKPLVPGCIPTLSPCSLCIWLMGHPYPAARQKERYWAAGYKADMTVGWTVTELLGGLTEREMSGGKTIRYPAPPAGNELEKPNQQC